MEPLIPALRSVPGHGGDVVGVELPGEQGGGAEHVPQAVPGPVAVAVLVTPPGQGVGGCQDAAVEVGGPPYLAARGREHQAERVTAASHLVLDLLDPRLDLLRERVAGRGPDRVDGLALLAALGCLGVLLAADLDDLAVHVDDAVPGIDLPDSQGVFLAVPQPGVRGGAGHQLVQVPAPALGQGLAEAVDIGVSGNLGRVDVLGGLPGHAGFRLRHCPAASLPPDIPQPRVDQVPGVQPGVDQRGQAPAYACPPHPGSGQRSRSSACGRQ